MASIVAKRINPFGRNDTERYVKANVMSKITFHAFLCVRETRRKIAYLFMKGA